MSPGFRTAVRFFLLPTAFLVSVVVLWAVVEFYLLRGLTPPITDSEGNTIPGSIATLESIPLSKANHRVMIRGRDSTKPVLLFIGGSGAIPLMGLAHGFQRELEESYLIVHRDRRKSDDTLRREESLEDLYELARYLRTRFNKDRIYLVAHSLGTRVAIRAVHERPDLFAAYVSIGQILPDDQRTRIIQRRFLYNMARAKRDSLLVTRLLSWDGTLDERDLIRYGGVIRTAKSLRPVLLGCLWAPEYDLIDVLRAASKRLHVTRSEGTNPGGEDEEIRNLDIPVFAFLGRYDYAAPSILSEEYFESLSAPIKKIVWFDRSAHVPFWEEPSKFRDEMAKVQTQVEGYWQLHAEARESR